VPAALVAGLPLVTSGQVRASYHDTMAGPEMASIDMLMCCCGAVFVRVSVPAGRPHASLHRGARR
jgi:hypothetical protein